MDPFWLETCVVLLAGVAAGAINAVVGSGTLVTFPTLVALGYPPVVATMSNAIGLVPGSITSTFGYRRELKGQLSMLIKLAPASLGGAGVGALLLLILPPEAFNAIVPVLIVLALVLVVLQPRIQRWVMQRRASNGRSNLGQGGLALVIGLVFVTGIYGGYFAAAQGILLIGILGSMLSQDLQRSNGLKNVLVGLVNSVAAIIYTIAGFDRIEWRVVAVIAVGSLTGGYLGAKWGRLLNPLVLRIIIVALGLVALWRILT